MLLFPKSSLAVLLGNQSVPPAPTALGTPRTSPQDPKGVRSNVVGATFWSDGY